MKKVKKQILLVLLVLLAGNVALFAQEGRVISGIVKDGDGSPVPGATITVKGTPQTVITDESGRYTVTLTGKNNTLIVSSVGFTSREVKPGSSGMLDIELSSAAADMDEVVVTALGVKRDK